MWRSYSFTRSVIDFLLDSSDCTLIALLDSTSLLEGLRNSSGRVADFCSQEHNIDALLQYALTGRLADEELTEDWNSAENITLRRRAYHASEILSLESSLIIDAIITPERIQYIFDFIDRPEKKESMLCFHFTRLLHFMMTKRSDAVMSYLEQRKDYVDKLLDNLSISELRDVYLIIASTVPRGAGANYLLDVSLPEKLFNIMENHSDLEFVLGASKCISELLRCGSSYATSLPVAEHLVSAGSLDRIIVKTFDRNLLSFKMGLAVLVSAAELHEEWPTRQDGQNRQIAFYDAILKHVDDIKANCQQMKDQPKGASAKPILTFERIQLVKLLVNICQLSGKSARDSFVSSGIISALMSLFLHFDRENLFHSAINELIMCYYDDDEEFAAFTTATDMIKFIVSNYPRAPSDGRYARPSSTSPCYFGHLHALASAFEAKWETLKDHLDDPTVQLWTKFASTDLSYELERRSPPKPQTEPEPEPEPELPPKRVVIEKVEKKDSALYSQYAYKIYSSEENTGDLNKENQESKDEWEGDGLLERDSFDQGFLNQGSVSLISNKNRYILLWCVTFICRKCLLSCIILPQHVAPCRNLITPLIHY
eukprot:TRINITY_DN4503_c0_g1_i3.p1 TRINITY_DN4503_c0_g1~~TRINITY_DN4503_c0_g1_i3.p1  ORF type:complete len:598 (+),score=91.75 TRINITY_DN4503_c0_g1_i3:69-1862(+)